MSFNWIKVSNHTALLKAKDQEIATLTAAAEAAGTNNNDKIIAIFGDAAKEEGFDLEAQVQSLVDYKAGLEGELETATAQLEASKKDHATATDRLNAVAALLGFEKAEGNDLTAAIEKIEPEARTNALVTNPPTPGAPNTSIMCEFDTDLANLKKELGIV